MPGGGHKGAAAFDRVRLRAARQAAGLTLAEVADAVGVAVATVSHWESGERKPQPDRVGELARALTLQPDDLLDLPPGEQGSLQHLRLAAGLLQRDVVEQAGMRRSWYGLLPQQRSPRSTSTSCRR